MRRAAATGRFLSNFWNATSSLPGKMETPTPAQWTHGVRIVGGAISEPVVVVRMELGNGDA
jgi:hypothetical protein